MSTLPQQQFYIAEEQSIYLLKANDARKHRAWLRLCRQQLGKLGYHSVTLIGKGAYGFVFAGHNRNGQEHVFKFCRLTLPHHIQDRLAEEAHILSLINHPHIPALIRFEQLGRQGIMVMQRAVGEDLAQYCRRHGPLSPGEIMTIARQLADILDYLRKGTPLVHGDIKPSNLVWDNSNQHLSLIDWGSAVFAQRDERGQAVAGNIMNLLSSEQHASNARLGDVYFIGDEQLNGALSNPRFDEQGVAGTLYALAAGLPSRFGSEVITPASLGLPRELADILSGMLSHDTKLRHRAGDYFIRAMTRTAKLLLPPLPAPPSQSPVPLWRLHSPTAIDTVSYSSRTSFLRDNSAITPCAPQQDELPVGHYYRNMLAGMADTEKGFITAISQLGRYPILGGLVIHWQAGEILVDSNLALHDDSMLHPVNRLLNNIINLARGIGKQGTFKACFFNARDTLHISRSHEQQPFTAAASQQLPFRLSHGPVPDDSAKLHSYFEDGQDPDENLVLPPAIMAELAILNRIHHTGCIIFEVLPTHMKIHSDFTLLNPRRQAAFRASLDRILAHLADIQGYGVAGYMKLPYKNTRSFSPLTQLPNHYYPKDPRSVSEQGLL